MRRLLSVFLSLFLILQLHAQDRTVTGKVTAGDDGGGLPGVNVVVQGTSKGTTTDVDGAFAISLLASETTLVFSFVGYETQTIQLGARTVVDVVMNTDASELDEIVVIGYGVVKKSDLTGSVASVRSEDLTKISTSSPMQALQGKIAGVQITSSSGAPGAGAIVRIRGTGTFNNSNPIYVVDGVITDNIDYLNSSDIERMEVLKDASAIAIYGSRGANGVIMVTTRQGSKGEQAPVINFSAEYGVQTLQNKIDLLSGREFAIVVNEINPGSFNNVDAVPNTDWQDLIFQSAPIQNYQFSATGGSKKMQYYYGLSFFKQDGIIAKSNFERLSIKINNTYHLNDNFRLGNNIAVSPSRIQNTNGNAPFVVYRAQPVITPYKADGGYSEVPGVGNVLADIENTNSFGKGMRTVSNFFGEVDITDGLLFRTSFGVDAEFGKGQSFTPAFYVSPQQQNATSDLSKRYSDRLTWLWENTISFNRDFADHHIDAVVGFTMQESSSEFLSAGGENIIRPGRDFWYLNADNVNGALIGNGVDIGSNYSMMSYLGRVNYNFKERYLFTATFRADGSSKFSSANKYGYFPALAAGWNIINEDFMAGAPAALSNLKIRASWGRIGNEKIPYDRIYSPVINGVGVVLGSGETVFPGSTYGVSGNPFLKWESTEQLDAGLELGFFNDQLKIEVGYYNRVTDNILIPLPVPGYLGNGEGARITYNAAKALNRGFEYDISYTGESGDFTYRIGTVGTTVHNEALRVFSSDEQPLYNGSQTTATFPGTALGSFFGYVVDGVFQTVEELNAYPHLSGTGVGDLKFRDVNNDGFLTPADRTTLGSSIPTFFYGLNVEVGYLGFDLSFDFQGQTGNKIYNYKETVRPDLYNFEQRVFNRWTGPGSSTTEPRATQGGNNFLASDRFLQDGSFVRLRNVTLGYSIPKTLSEKVRMKSARVYVRGTNIFTKTKFNGYSPEIGSDNPLDNGIDFSGYPVTSMYSAGFNLTF